LLPINEHFCRSTLPPGLDQLLFRIVPSSISSEPGQNFYHLGDYFVVSDSMRQFLEAHAGCAFESRPIATQHPQGTPMEPYWAMKVMTRIDCVLPDQSWAWPRGWSTSPPQSFRSLQMEVKLADDVAPFYANKGSDTYCAYPGSAVASVAMDFSSVPEGIRLFAPLYWPEFLVIDGQLACDLERQCKGGSLGYYFWTLGFDAVAADYEQLMLSLR
jgi:hypothetical protein